MPLADEGVLDFKFSTNSHLHAYVNGCFREVSRLRFEMTPKSRQINIDI